MDKTRLEIDELQELDTKSYFAIYKINPLNVNVTLI